MTRRDFLTSFAGAGIGLVSPKDPEQNEDKQDEVEQGKKLDEMRKYIERHEKLFTTLAEILDYNAEVYNRNREDVRKRLAKIEQTIFQNNFRQEEHEV